MASFAGTQAGKRRPPGQRSSVGSSAEDADEEGSEEVESEDDLSYKQPPK